jgi:hypothetical protein
MSLTNEELQLACCPDCLAPSAELFNTTEEKFVEKPDLTLVTFW